MIWTSDEAYRRGIDVMSEVVEQVPGDAWGRPSPCEGWRALDVLGHVGAATAMGLHILRGEAPDLGFGRQDPPGDAVRADPLLWWTGLAAPAREAVAEIDDLGLERVVDTPMGRRSVRDGLRFPAADLFLHAWDIAAATDVSVSIPDDAVPFVRARRRGSTRGDALAGGVRRRGVRPRRCHCGRPSPRVDRAEPPMGVAHPMNAALVGQPHRRGVRAERLGSTQRARISSSRRFKMT